MNKSPLERQINGYSTYLSFDNTLEVVDLTTLVEWVDKLKNTPWVIEPKISVQYNRYSYIQVVGDIYTETEEEWKDRLTKLQKEIEEKLQNEDTLQETT